MEKEAELEAESFSLCVFIFSNMNSFRFLYISMVSFDLSVKKTISIPAIQYTDSSIIEKVSIVFSV